MATRSREEKDLWEKRMREDIQRTILIATLTLCMALAAACSSDTGPTTGSESHWLEACEATRDCAPGLACQCGVCTISCAEDVTCSGRALEASCIQAQDTSELCASSLGWASAICLPGCVEEADCDRVDPSLTCSPKGICQREEGGAWEIEDRGDSGSGGRLGYGSGSAGLGWNDRGYGRRPRLQRGYRILDPLRDDMEDRQPGQDE